MNKKQKDKLFKDIFYSVLDGGNFHKTFKKIKKKKGVKNGRG